MRYEWDDKKAATNIKKHGVSFEAAERFEWDSALVMEDDRRVYSEKRYTAAGYIDGRFHIMVLTTRETTIRIISLRKANRRESMLYGDAKTT